MAKRSLFDELMQGVDELKAEREGKLTLKTTEIEAPKPICITAKQIAEIREKYQYSQGVFAAMLATNVKTLRNWEQGRSEPNAQAKVLLKLVDADPNLLHSLVSITTGVPAVKTKSKAAAKKKGTPKKTAVARKKAPAKHRAAVA